MVQCLRANTSRFKEVMLQIAQDPQFPRPRLHTLHMLCKVWLAVKPDKSIRQMFGLVLLIPVVVYTAWL